MHCPKCKRDGGNTGICGYCGLELSKRKLKQDYKSLYTEDYATKLQVFLSFIFPIAGIIWFIMWFHDYPKKAQSVGLAAMFSILIFGIVIIL